MSEIMRQFTDALQTMIKGKGSSMFLMEYKNGKLGKNFSAVKVVKKHKNGTLTIKPCKADGDSPRTRKKIAGEIVALIEDKLKERVGRMVKEALFFRRKDELKQMKKEIMAEIKKTGQANVNLSGSRGCVYLSHGEREILL